MRHHKPRGCSTTYVQLLGRERPAPHTGGVRFYHTNRRPDRLWRNSQAGADPSNHRRGRSDVRVCPKIDIQHQCVGPLYEYALPSLQSRVDIGDTVDDERLQPRCQSLYRKSQIEIGKRGVIRINLVPNNLPFGIVFEVAVSFISAFN